MARSRTPSQPSQPHRARTQPVDLGSVHNFPTRPLRGPFWRSLAARVQGFPAGPQKPWGIPFDLPEAGPGPRVVMVRRGDEVRLSVGGTATHLCLLHLFCKAPDDGAQYLEGEPLAEYDVVYASGAVHRVPVRARLDVTIPESPGPALLAVPFAMPRAQDPAAVPPPEAWGRLQHGLVFGPGEPLLWALEVPRPDEPIAALLVRGLAASPFLVAGLTRFTGAAHPLRHLPRRMYRVTGADGQPVPVVDLQVDMGAVARVDAAGARRGRTWLRAPHAGLDQAAETDSGERLYSLYGAADATVSARLKGERRPVAFSLGEAHSRGRSTSGRWTLARLGGRKQWVEFEVQDGSTGRPTPVRLHLSGAGGEYIAPYGHHEQVNANWFEDYGADLKVAGRQYAYVHGRFATDVPAGPLYVEMTKGFEYRPTRVRVDVRPGQRQVTLKIERWRDLRAQGWVTADTHVHFLSPQTAWLEAQAEGINVVNLLASQWGRLFTNVGDISGRLGVAEDDTLVWVGTENRNHMLGHISMLGTKGLPVYPMCCGGASEAWVGDPDYRALTEWAQECRAKDGVVIRPHFPYCGFTEDPVLAVKGVVDALEIRQNRDGGFPLQEWYRYLNNGYRVAVAGGTDKMGAYCALGNLRTYAFVGTDEPLTYEAWARAVRAGRTVSTNGPLLDLRVDGRQAGEAIAMGADGGTVEVQVVAECAWEVGSVEIVHNGAVVAREEEPAGAERICLAARIPVQGSGWLAARCSGVGNTPASYLAAHTSPVYVQCGERVAYDGPALQHMLNLTRGGIEYLQTLSTCFDDREQERMIRLYREVEEHLQERLELGR
ncbi:MAG: CehA/McbA family metallohydrolase [Candidatus Latescibacterota bacterium]